MKSETWLSAPSELAEWQWGLFTSAQAFERGVSRATLSRMVEAKRIHRLRHGVYRVAGVPEDPRESIRAAWLSLDPKRTSEQRLDTPLTGAVVSGASAAALLRIGDLAAFRHEFTLPARRQTQRSDIFFRRRALAPGDVTIIDGLPTTTPERTITDLVADRTDLSLVADALRDAVYIRSVNPVTLDSLLAPLAARNGFPAGDGAAFRADLVSVAGLSTTHLASAIAEVDELGALVTFEYLRMALKKVGAADDKAVVRPEVDPAEFKHMLRNLGRLINNASNISAPTRLSTQNVKGMSNIAKALLAFCDASRSLNSPSNPVTANEESSA